MQRPLSLRTLVIHSLMLFSIVTTLSYLFSHYKSQGVFDAIFEIGFPWEFYVIGGIANLHLFSPIPFLLDLVFAFVIVFGISRIYENNQWEAA